MLQEMKEPLGTRTSACERQIFMMTKGLLMHPEDIKLLEIVDVTADCKHQHRRVKPMADAGDLKSHQRGCRTGHPQPVHAHTQSTLPSPGTARTVFRCTRDTLQSHAVDCRTNLNSPRAEIKDYTI